MATPNQTLSRVTQFWAGRSSNQKVLLGLGAALTVGLIAFFAQLIAAPDYKPLMSGLEPADAQTLSSELGAKKIAFKLSPDGRSISVAADQLDAARLEVASNQSPHSGRMGFEIFDKVSWGQTEFDEKVNYQRALEGELERTILTLSGVKSVRVHLVMANDSVFIDRERSAKASVALKLSRGTLSREEAASIQRLVAGAVDGLKPSDISIIDADSNEALGSAGEGAQGADGIERQLMQRLVATLTPIVGVDHLRASVNVEFDPGTTEESQEKYDPVVSVPLSVQRSDERSGSGGAVAGVPGTASNVPQSGAGANKPNVPSTTTGDAPYTSTTENSTFGVNKITRHMTEPAGRIRRISAALLVDDMIQRKPGPKGKWIETAIKRSPEEIKQIQDLAQAAIGLDPARGDVISVQDMSFDHPLAADLPLPSIVDKIRQGLNDYASVVRYSMLLILFLLAYLLMIRPVQKRALAAGAAPVAKPPEPVRPVLPEPAQKEALPPSNEAAQVLALKEQVAHMVKTEPITSSNAMQVWLRGDTA